MRTVEAILVALLAASVPGVALADEPRPPPPPPPRVGMAMTFTRKPGAESCPPPSTMQVFLIGEYDYDPFDLGKEEVHVVVDLTLSRKGGKYHGEYTIARPNGEVLWAQEMEDPRCAEVLKDIANAIPIYTDILFPAPRSAPPPPPAPEPTPPAPAAPAPAPPTPARPAPPPTAPPKAPPDRARFILGLGAGLMLKTTAPLVSGSLAADAGFHRHDFSLYSEFRWAPPAVVAIDPSGRAQVTAMQLTGGLLPCYQGPLLLCGAVEVVIVVPKASPPFALTPAPVVGVAVGGRVGKDLQIAAGGFAVRVTGDVLGTLHDAGGSYNRAQSPTWQAVGLALVGGVGVVWSN